MIALKSKVTELETQLRATEQKLAAALQRTTMLEAELNAARESERKLTAALESASLDAAARQRQMETRLGQLQANLAKLSGGRNPFVQLSAQDLRLFTSITRIQAHRDGTLYQINGEPCGLDVEITAAELAALVSAHYASQRDQDQRQGED